MDRNVPRITRRCLLCWVLAVAGLFLVGGCGGPTRPLTIASHVWPGYELMFLADHEGWLDTRDLRLLKTGSATDSLTMLTRGDADGAALTLDEVLRLRANGIPLQVVLVFDESAGGDALLVRPAIKSLADLAGRRIGVETSALGSVMLGRILEAAGLDRDAVTIVNTEIDDHLDAWQNSRLDAIVTYEPVLSRLLAMGAVRLFDSRQTPGMILDVLAVKPDVAANHDSALRALIAGHFRALDHLNSNPQDAVYRLAGRLGLDGPEVLAVMRGLELPDLDANRAYFADDGNLLRESAQHLSDRMHAAGLLTTKDSLVGLADGAYLPR